MFPSEKGIRFMKEVFKQLIIDFHARELPNPSQRQVNIPVFPASIRKAVVFIGMRRSGKTWVMYQIMRDLMSKGTPFKKILYVDFSDDRLADMQAKDWQLLLDAYFELYPELILDSGLHFFLDEIHDAPAWQKFIRRLLDTESMKLYLSGSSAKLLSREIATELRGRCVTREIFPLSFSEYLKFHGIQVGRHLSSKEKSVINSHLQKYLHQGGFPEIQRTQSEFHRELLQGYVDTVIYRDIAERYKIGNLVALKRFIFHCLQNAASPLSINKIYNTFRSLGLSVGKNALYEYLGHAEDAYCVFAVPAFELSARKSGLKSKKIYPVDSGLITAYTVKDQMEHGARFETAVFGHLRRQEQQLFYFETALGREVDFLAQNSDGTIKLFQACLSLKDLNTREREIRALEEAMQMLQVDHGTIVTLDESEEIRVQSGLIRCVPFSAWSVN